MFREVQVSTHLKTEVHMTMHVTNTNPAQCNLESKLLLNKSQIYIFTQSVKIYGFGSYYIHGRAFLETLGTVPILYYNKNYSLHYTLYYAVSTSRHLKKMLAVTAPPVLSLQCRKIGDSSNVLEYTVSRVTDQSIDVTESIINKPDKFPGMTCKFTNVS